MTRKTIGIIGLGEAGRLYAEGLVAAGAAVHGFDTINLVGANYEVASLAQAVTPSDVVLSLVGAASATAVAVEAIPLLRPGAVFAELNTGSPELKADIAQIAIASGTLMADVAVMAPVPRAGHRTPLLASGPGAQPFKDLVTQFGVPVEVIGALAGDAARLKLLRTVFMKGLAALVIESLGAAREVGADDWMRAEIAGELGPDGALLVDRLVEGTYEHVQRRLHEVEDALRAIESGETPSDMTRATLAWFTRIAESD